MKRMMRKAFGCLHAIATKRIAVPIVENGKVVKVNRERVLVPYPLWRVYVRFFLGVLLLGSAFFGLIAEVDERISPMWLFVSYKAVSLAIGYMGWRLYEPARKVLENGVK